VVVEGRFKVDVHNVLALLEVEFDSAIVGIVTVECRMIIENLEAGQFVAIRGEGLADNANHGYLSIIVEEFIPETAWKLLDWSIVVIAEYIHLISFGILG
jgi:hypothetical protein